MLSIPRSLYPDLRHFGALATEQREGLAEVFVNTAPVTSMASLTADVFTAWGQRSVSLDALEEMIRMFASIAIFCERAQRSVDEVVKALTADEDLGGEVWTVAGVALKRIVDSKALRALAKATDVSLENERTVRSSRICTDIRPVFTEGAAAPPALAVLTHTLRFECDGDLQHEYFTLSQAALRRLKSVVDRALEKENTLTAALAAGLKIQVFATEDDQDDR